MPERSLRIRQRNITPAFPDSDHDGCQWERQAFYYLAACPSSPKTWQAPIVFVSFAVSVGVCTAILLASHAICGLLLPSRTDRNRRKTKDVAHVA
ncbi:hypothetical protein [Prevotella corporis]|uniref:hypothetical protein n=1 Tax=Prevotella corporis TaxID=28128 RepID=UPI0023670686|nr:hypothetical protein [Prevotella corporis]